MRDALGLVASYIGASVRSQMQYKTSMALLTLAHLLSTGIELLGLAVLFDHFGQLRGWGLAEVAVFYGLTNVAFSLADAIGTGFDRFGTLVKSGGFDRLLLRPRSTALQLAAQELTLRRTGRLAQALVALGAGTVWLGLRWTVTKLALAVFAVAGAACLFVGLLIIQATLAFWTTESLEVMNTVTYGGVQAFQYPVTIYDDWFRKLFTYLVPLALTCYYPVLVILERADPLGGPTWLGWLSPLVGPAFCGAALFLWRVGERHYRSTGS
jgi:ABC-2 type transport system permease protein